MAGTALWFLLFQSVLYTALVRAKYTVYCACVYRLDAVNCKRINVGGSHAAAYMQRLLQLKYPAHQAAITPSRMEELLHHHCYVAVDYQQGKLLYPALNRDISNTDLKIGVIEITVTE